MVSTTAVPGTAPDPDLGTRLDRAAGALGHSHPERAPSWRPDGYRPFDRSWVADGSGDVLVRHSTRGLRGHTGFNHLGVLDSDDVADAFRP